jgi:hypothetical protein
MCKGGSTLYADLHTIDMLLLGSHIQAFAVISFNPCMVGSKAN